MAPLCAGVFALIMGFAALTTPAFSAETSADPPNPGGPPSRIEARSADLLAVGIVRGDRMTIHVSRMTDNAPVRNAVLTVLLRGVVHPTTAEADGSYTLQSNDLNLPGSAALEFQILQGAARADLKGTLLVAGKPSTKAEEKNVARQLWWWVLNFAVCIGFLMLIARRRKAAAQD